MKKCSKCGETKDLSEFSKCKARQDGYQARCKSCDNFFNQQYDKTPERKLYRKQHYQIPNIKLAKQKYHQTPEYKFGQYKHSAKKRGYSFELSFDQFISLRNQPCKYCGQQGPNGIDRINNSVGYTPENSAACCSKCNQIKSNWSAKQMYSHILKMIKHSFKNWHFSRLES